MEEEDAVGPRKFQKGAGNLCSKLGLEKEKQKARELFWKTKDH